jgi:ubiquinone/menaquinone biosynthesis C-methylase UbiE
MDSIVDVGCGNGLMVQWLLKNRKLSRVAAVDWAANFEMPSGIEFHRAAAHDLPFDDDSFDYLTAFDMLEHLLPSDVEPAFREFRRVARIGFVFSICTRASIDWNINGQKTQLHPTVQPKEWWRDQIETICQADVEFWPGGTEGFFHGTLR